MCDGSQLLKFHLINPESISCSILRTFGVVEHTFFFSKFRGVRNRDNIFLPVGINLHSSQGDEVF